MSQAPCTRHAQGSRRAVCDPSTSQVKQQRRLTRRTKAVCRASKFIDRQHTTKTKLQLSQDCAHAVLQQLQQQGALLRTTAAAAAISAALMASPVEAADFAKVGTCLLTSCQVALAKCLGDGECLENLACLNLCNGKKDETECQIRCGDLYSDKAIATFNTCAVSDKKCVPQRIDTEASFPTPATSKLDEGFDLKGFQGRWYITAGLNPLFDTFDCQEHYFGVPEDGKLVAKINWRIPKGKTDFIERSVVQRFVQQSDPAILLNHGNDFLHYEDDWFIVKYRPEAYNFVYYKGNNDAWKGYGGATVYTRASSLPQEYVPELQEAARSVGLKWENFKVTDNSCKPHPRPEKRPGRLGELAEDEARALEYTIENDLTSFGKGFTVLEQGLLAELRRDEQGFADGLGKELKEAEGFLEGIEKQYHLPDFLKWLPFKQFFGIT